MRELSDEARAMLRDFILVFDLEGFFKGSTEITEAEGAQVLEYMTSMFELAGLPIPTTCMSAKGLAKRSKALRSSNQPLKKERACLETGCVVGLPRRAVRAERCGRHFAASRL
jgi:hypothetical protein